MLRVARILVRHFAEAAFKRDAKYFVDLMRSFGYTVLEKEASTGTMYVKVRGDRSKPPLNIRFSGHGIPKVKDYKRSEVDLSVDPDTRKTVGDAVNLVRIHYSNHQTQA